MHQQSRYLIVVRDPIRRALSAFNWRYRLVVREGSQKNRFEGEFDTLCRYETLDALALSLYGENGLDLAAARDFRAIHHLREDISFYLGDLLDAIRPVQIYGVLFTERLAWDAQRVLDVATLRTVHENKSATPPSQKHLSQQAIDNLRRFLAEDFNAIDKLLAMHPVPVTPEMTSV